jgi:hypothetical protein
VQALEKRQAEFDENLSLANAQLQGIRAEKAGVKKADCSEMKILEGRVFKTLELQDDAWDKAKKKMKELITNLEQGIIVCKWLNVSVRVLTICSWSRTE